MNKPLNEKPTKADVIDSFKDLQDMFSAPFSSEKRDFSNGRFYRQIREDQEPNEGPWFPSVTTVINQTLSKGPFFNKWLCGLLNYEEYQKILDETSLLGEIVHKFCMDLVRGRSLDLKRPFLSEVNDKDKLLSTSLFNFNSIDVSGAEYSKRLEDFEAFWEEFEPIPLAVEIPLLNPTMHDTITHFHEDGSSVIPVELYHVYPFAGQPDLICKIKDETWLIDWKTGSSLWDSHELQVTAYKILWDSLFPDYQIERLGLLHLKDSCKTPKGRLKEVKFAPKTWNAILDLWDWRSNCQPSFEEERKLEFNLYPEEEDEKIL